MFNIHLKFLICLMFCAGTSFGESLSSYRSAIKELKTLAQLPGEDPVTPLIDSFETYQKAIQNLKDPQKAVFEEWRMQEWGNRITEFVSLATLLFSFQNPDFQEMNASKFDQASQSVARFRRTVNEFIRTYHPGLSVGIDELPSHLNGRGITIAVFDVFEPDLLAKQRGYYSQGTIEDLVSFGDPVALNHGNSVIDIILSIAPKARIVPIASDSSNYGQAIQWISTRDDITIVNMSRAFAEQNGKLDPQFSLALQKVLDSKIVSKSLGNTGTDLLGNLSPIREELNLPPLGSLFSYDLKLIDEFVSSHQKTSSNLLFSINLALSKEQTARTATVPGDHTGVQDQSFGIAADGIYTWSTNNFEAGSSFAAPQLTGVVALLLDHQLRAHGKLKPNLVAQALKATVQEGQLGPEQTGRGLLHAGDAWRWLKNHDIASCTP
ncbi:S8/S53 family peptidase [Pseudobacteriovorax antillogorgiicola]|uniref:Subtilase family protein n=1 Tax=Pseudobacteriovorax antillogorgiicola TaxID=1513793 RepID=A0A1Y6CI76_9BACT|nr:S8/S53 family peptidase [Pseudobacteriovorax antillogorgiicola]TCS48277.1 hypothetical protein EDD56_11857 [Pseudobacteriovorax antillogorgiicola]SMF57040.1 hypothetical protein SAMN06296036_11884 [Pseudobacteriovorax antillogorgiicola]